MPTLNFSYRKGRVFMESEDDDLYDAILEEFTKKNPLHFVSDNMPDTIQAFNSFGGVLPGLIWDVIEVAKRIAPNVTIKMTAEAKAIVRPLRIKNPRLKSYLKEGFDDRDYQMNALDMAFKYGRGIFKFATGAGKSAVIYNLCRNLLDNNIGPVMVLVPTTQLVLQMGNDFDEYGCPGYIYQRFWSEDNTINDAPVIITNRDYITNFSHANITKEKAKLKQLKVDYKKISNTSNVDVINGIVDSRKITYDAKTLKDIITANYNPETGESIHIYNRDGTISKKYKTLKCIKDAERIKTLLVGLSTKKPKDKLKARERKGIQGELRAFYDKPYVMSILSTKIELLVTRINWLVTCKTDKFDKVQAVICDEAHGLVRDNRITNYVQRMKTNIKFGCTGTIQEEYDKKWSVIGTLGKVFAEKDILSLQSEGVLSEVNINAIQLRHSIRADNKIYISKDENGETVDKKVHYNIECAYLEDHIESRNMIAKAISRMKGNSIMIFTHTEYGRAIYKYLQEAGKEVYYADGSTPVAEREAIRMKVEAADNAIVVGHVNVMSTGVNIKKLHNIIFSSGGKSLVQVIQSIGRALRKHITKTHATIWDFHHDYQYSLKHYMERRVLYSKHYGKHVKICKYVSV